MDTEGEGQVDRQEQSDRVRCLGINRGRGSERQVETEGEVQVDRQKQSDRVQEYRQKQKERIR